MKKKSIATPREIKEAMKAKAPIEVYRHIWGTHGTHGERVVLTFGPDGHCYAEAEATDTKDSMGNHVWEKTKNNNKASVLSKGLTALCQEFTQEFD